MSIPPAFAAKKTTYRHLFTVAMDDEADAAVRAYAQRSGVKIATAIRELIEYGLESVNDDANA